MGDPHWGRANPDRLQLWVTYTAAGTSLKDCGHE